MNVAAADAFMKLFGYTREDIAMTSRSDRYAVYMEAYQRTAPIAEVLPEHIPAVNFEGLPTAESFALSAANNALKALMDALVVLHELTEPEDDDAN